MLTLGIETSCDETSCAVLRDRDELLSNIIATSLFRHQPFGGVVPEIASRYALEQIDAVLSEALSKAGVKLGEIDLIAVTYGPGLIGSLFVGVGFAKTLAYQMNVPLIGVNHLEAHLAANFIGVEEPEKYVGLLVSGGHTSLSLHEKGKAKLLGETIDDAVGEAFDKVGKLLGLGFPGGPVIEKLAREGDSARFPFTFPKLDQPFGFSFSGIKTAVRILVEKEVHRPSTIDHGQLIQSNQQNSMDHRLSTIDSQWVKDLCASFQKAVVHWLIRRTLQAAEKYEVKAVAVGGGVSINQYLRDQLIEQAEAVGIKVYFPQKILTLDNAGMIARRGWELFQTGYRSDFHLTALPNLAL